MTKDKTRIISNKLLYTILIIAGTGVLAILKVAFNSRNHNISQPQTAYKNSSVPRSVRSANSSLADSKHQTNLSANLMNSDFSQHSLPLEDTNVTVNRRSDLPQDMLKQLNSPPPELPEDLRRQLTSPPPTLPADLQAQLNAPPPTLPEDLKRALRQPARVVTEEEVNGKTGNQ